jgi:hypothetical protein
MELHDQEELELEIGRELERLPDLPAPATLIPRVMAAIAARAAVPWYRQPWQAWPGPGRLAFLALLLALFIGLCFGSREALRIAFLAPGIQQLGQLLSSLTTVQQALSTAAGIGGLAVRQLGTSVLLATCLAVALSYALCVGLGALCVRLAYSRR